MNSMDAIRNRHLFFIDIILILISVWLSFVLRLEQVWPYNFEKGLLVFATSALIAIPSMLVTLRLYSRFWRYASITDLLELGLAIFIGSTLTTGLTWTILVFLPGLSIPRSIPVIFLAVATILLIIPRLVLRFVRYFGAANNHNGKRVLIIGAGDSGAMVLREIQLSNHVNMDVVGFIDDDPLKRDARIAGVHVLGVIHEIPQIVRRYSIQQVLVSIPSAPGKTIRSIVELCDQAEVPVKVMPGLSELLDGTVSVRQLRDVAIEDLLRRDPIKTDSVAVRNLLSGKRVLITGAGGSIGGELCRQVLRSQPSALILLGHGENSIFGIHNELKDTLRILEMERDVELVPVIADIRFKDRIQSVFEQYQPEIVFHAAAHKHVPLMEYNPAEAITNNVYGTKNLLDAAQSTNVERFVMISTDKAVNPTNVMGASKRAAEQLVHRAAERSGKSYVAVRFGNVLGSRGSVVLTFQQQIAKGGPITVTHPDITRFFMTIPEAVQLVLQAFVLGTGGEVFVLNMGQPVKIMDLARDLIELSGLTVGEDIDIEVTGLRPGEKLYEELFIAGEAYSETAHNKIFVANNAGNFIPEDLEERVSQLISIANRGSENQLRHELSRIVPEYVLPK